MARRYKPIDFLEESYGRGQKFFFGIFFKICMQCILTISILPQLLPDLLCFYSFQNICYQITSLTDPQNFLNRVTSFLSLINSALIVSCTHILHPNYLLSSLLPLSLFLPLQIFLPYSMASCSNLLSVEITQGHLCDSGFRTIHWPVGSVGHVQLKATSTPFQNVSSQWFCSNG